MSNMNIKKYRMLFYPEYNKLLRVFIDSDNKVYLCLCDLSVAVSYSAAKKCKEELPLTKIYSKECVNPFQGGSIITVLWDDFKKIEDKVEMPGRDMNYKVNLSPFIERFTKFLKNQNRKITISSQEQKLTAKSEATTESESELTDILSRADSFVNEVHMLIEENSKLHEENRMLKVRLEDVLYRISKYERVRDMMVSV